MTPQKLHSVTDLDENLRRKGHMVTYDLDYFDFFHIKPEDIKLERIADSLSRIFRYRGICKMSVAQHSCKGAEAFLLMGDLDGAFQFLHHDDSEYFTGDWPSPIKNLLSKEIKEAVERIEKEVATHFNFQYPFGEKIHTVDRNLYAYEISIMIGKKEIYTDYWNPKKAKKNYLEMHERILHLLSIRNKFDGRES